MKKLMSVLLLLVTLSSLALPCYANDAVIEITPPTHCGPQIFTTVYDTWGKYESFLQENTLPETFVPYERLNLFGEFSQLRIWHYRQEIPQAFAIMQYTVVDANNVSFYIIVPCSSSYDISTAEEVDWSLFPDMRSTKGTAHEGYAALRLGNLTLIYGEDSLLHTIEFEYNGRSCQITTCEGAPLLAKYPLDAQSTLMARLLNPETAEDAAEDLYDHLSGKAQMRQKALRVTALSVLTGVFVTALAAFIICKRVKKPHRFGGNEEIPVMDAPPRDAPSEE